MVDFYKKTHWSKKQSKFVIEATEEAYNNMREMMDNLEPEQRADKVAVSVFREILDHRPGYARELGEMVILETKRQRNLEREKEYLVAIEKYKNAAESSNREMETMKAKITALEEKQEATERMFRDKQEATERMLREIVTAYSTLIVSCQETQ